MKMEIGGELVEVEPNLITERQGAEALIIGLIVGFVFGFFVAMFILE